MKTLADTKNADQARKIKLAERDFARGVSEKERDIVLHQLDLATHCGDGILTRDAARECRYRLLRSIY